MNDLSLLQAGAGALGVGAMGYFTNSLGLLMDASRAERGRHE